MKREEDIIAHDFLNHIRLTIADVEHKAPHTHEEMELCVVLEENMKVSLSSETFLAKKGDVFVVNPYTRHEFYAPSGAKVLMLQIPVNFFEEVFPHMREIEVCAKPMSNAKTVKKVMKLAVAFIGKREFYELRCAGLLYSIFYDILRECGCQEREEIAAGKKERRIGHIVRYIERNYARKLLLSDIAKQEGVTVCYLSHLFKDSFGISFQEYLQKIRSEKAMKLLNMTQMSILDISIHCGFSDPKYLNKGIEKYYGMTPRQVRKERDKEVMERKKEEERIRQEMSLEGNLETLRHFLNL